MLLEQVGEAPPGQFPTIAYIGPNDARYMVNTRYTLPYLLSLTNGNIR